MTRCILAIALFVFSCTGPLNAAQQTEPTANEIRQAKQWVETHWTMEESTPPVPVGLTVHENYDLVLKRQHRGNPLNISGTKFTRGLFTHAASHLQVMLPKPGKTFTAVLGVDSNFMTSGGRGSVRFTVKRDGNEKFRSEVLREGMKPVEIAIDLAGATGFDIIVDNADDGISCDQSVWADAKVVFEDGSEMFLDDLPIHAPVRSSGLPFSFRYGEIPSAEFLKQCRFEKKIDKPDEARTRHTLLWQDEKTGLETRMVGVEYADYPAVEWTVFFKNSGKENTPLLTKVNAADLTLPSDGGREPILHHHIGSCCSSNDYRPLEARMSSGTSRRFGGTDGRPSNRDWPYFNVARSGPDGGGTIVVVGWPGQWEAEFACPSQQIRQGEIAVKAGQQNVGISLRPGEEFRTPMIALMFWDGDRLRSQNVWRRWFLAHNAPKLSDGKVPKYHWTINTSPYYWEMIGASTENQIMFIDGLLERGLFIDYWWMDAGWYVNNGHWANTGTWEVDEKRFPGGLRVISDHAKTKGVKTLVWFEPERVTGGTWLTENHPEWVLGGKDGGLLNLGHPEAWQWCVNHIDGLIKSQGIDLYRQDFNMGPLGSFHLGDGGDENRRGATENKHVCGYLAFWDELRRRHPDMPIDSCASGGRRNDLETLRRAIILHRSDNYETTGNQGQSFGIASWTPLFGIGAGGDDPYHFRSMMTPYQNSSFDVRDENSDFAVFRKYQSDWKRINKYYSQDYYPLTAYSDREDVWLAWQYNAYDGAGGIVQVFKRPESPYITSRLRMHGLDPDAVYRFEDLDGRPALEFSGRELLEKGLPLTIEESRVALILEYRRKDSSP